MEYLLPFQTTIMGGIFALLLFLYSLLWISRSAQRNARKKITAPEAAGAWPVIGHLHLLAGSSLLLHRTLGAMADKYGPIFTIKLGMHPALVISNWEMAKECFTTNDRVFASRPKSVAVELMGYNYALFGLGPYGAYWRQVRKIVMLELLSNRRIEMMAHVRESEVKASIKEIYDRWVKNKSASDMVMVDMKRWFGDLTVNVIVRMVAGKRYTSDEDGEGRRLQKAMKEFFELVGIFVASDSFPYLRWLDIGGYEKAMKKTGKELDDIFEGWLQAHKQRRISGQVKGKEDFMDVMLSILDDAATTEDVPIYDADTINKSTCMAALSGGTDTTTVTLTWALSLLLNNRHVLKKAQDELDTHVGKERPVAESDVKNLVYLQAILKETLRLYPAAPLSAPHESTEDCIVGGYNIPMGTRLVANLSKIQRDPCVWSDPCEFLPERFLTTHKDVDVRGLHFELIPFGSGRRMCPGMSFTLHVMQLTLATLLHGFEIATLAGEPVDMTESFGLSNHKATPLEVLLTPRLSSNMY